jgi:hypothetical protein
MSRSVNTALSMSLALALTFASSGAGASPNDSAPSPTSTVTNAPSVDPAASADALKRVYEAAKASVVQVGADTTGAGVVVSEDGLVVTAYALVHNQTTMPVTFTNGFKTTARVVATSTELSVALLRLDGLPAMAFLKSSSAPPAVGQAAYSFSLQRALVPSVTFARIATTAVMREKKPDERVFTAHFAFNPHLVGGPVVNWNGELMGVLLANDQNGTGFALSMPALLDYMATQASALPTVATSVSSEPSGAEVLLDGVSSGKTPLKLNLAAGSHVVQLRSPGLPDTLRKVVALGKPQLDLSLVLFPGAAVSVKVPENAEVWIDGILRARGSATLWLPSGRHWVGALMQGRRPFGRYVEVVEDRPIVVTAELPEAHAALSVDSLPGGAEVLLDDNKIGVTPLKEQRIPPGNYELTVNYKGYHPTTMPLQARDGQTIDLGKLKLQAPQTLMRAVVPSQTEVSIDDGPKHPVRPTGEPITAGTHRAVFTAPYQYRSVVDFKGEDGQTVTLTPTFVAAGDPDSRDTYKTLSTVAEGAGGVGILVAAGFFLAAEAERQNATSSGGTLSPSGHSSIAVGLTAGAIGIGLYAVGALVNSLQPTPEMGWDEDAPKADVPKADAPKAEVTKPAT